MTDDLKSRLNRAIHKVVGRRKGSFTGADIAADIIQSEPELWQEARDVLATEKLISMANGTLRGPLHEPNSAQLPLAGFEDMPKYIRAGKKWVDIRDANAKQLAEFSEWYRERVERNAERTKRDKRILADVERLSRILSRYDRKTPGITVSQVLEIREVRAEFRSGFQPS
jgi:hypothetical protein